MAKDHLLRWARLYDGGYDMSGFTREIGELKNAIDPANMHAIVDTVRWSLPYGHREVGIDGYQALMDDTASTGSHTLLKAPSAATQATVLFGGAGVPAVGDPAYVLSAARRISDAPRTFSENAALLQVNYVSDAEQTDTNKPWGQALSIDVSVTETTNGTAVLAYADASSAKGGHVTLHILATSSGNYALKIQDSPNNSDWSDLLTFTSTGGALAGEQATVTGTVDKWLRFQATKTAGTFTAICAFARN